MAKNEKFEIGFLKTIKSKEDLFLSVTPGLEHGPGIQRDGITMPRMTDPHSSTYVCNANDFQPLTDLSSTTDPFVQRAGSTRRGFPRRHGVDHQRLCPGDGGGRSAERLPGVRSAGGDR